MVRSTIWFLRAVLTLIGFIMLALCTIWLPLAISNFSLDGYDPILISLYLPAIPFFIAVFQSFKLLGFIEKSQVFSESGVKAFKTIKLSALAIWLIFSVEMPYIFYVANQDDAPGVILITFVIIFASMVIGTFAYLLEQLIKNAVKIKSENDLTV